MINPLISQQPIKEDFFQLDNERLGQYIEAKKSELLKMLDDKSLNGRKH